MLSNTVIKLGRIIGGDCLLIYFPAKSVVTKIGIEGTN